MDSTDHLFSSRDADIGAANDLSIGAPGADILSRLPPMFRAATEQRMEAEEQVNAASLFQYGPETGLASFRRHLSNLLSRRYEDAEVELDSLLVTSGATAGLDLIASRLLSRDAVVFVDDPTYFIATKILADDLGLNVVPVKMDFSCRAGPGNDDIWNVQQLENAVLDQLNKRSQKSSNQPDHGRYWGMIYTIPNFHNPTGAIMSRAVGKNVISLARRHNLLVMCDDVYNLLSYGDGGVQQPRDGFSRLKALEADTEDAHRVVISNGSFSKILSPGVRLGWLELPLHLCRRLAGSGFIQSGGSPNNYTSGIVSSLLSTPCCKVLERIENDGHEIGKAHAGDCECPSIMDYHLDALRAIYSERMTLALNYLKEHLPASGWRVITGLGGQPLGGYFIWIQGDRDLTGSCFYDRLSKVGVTVLPGERTAVGNHVSPSDEESGVPFRKDCFRLSIAFYCLDRLLTGCQHVCKIANEICNDVDKVV